MPDNVTREAYPGGVPGLPDNVTREAYSHEVSSDGRGRGIGWLVAPVGEDPDSSALFIWSRGFTV